MNSTRRWVSRFSLTRMLRNTNFVSSTCLVTLGIPKEMMYCIKITTGAIKGHRSDPSALQGHPVQDSLSADETQLLGRIPGVVPRDFNEL